VVLEKEDTIAALATPDGQGALAVIRISGPAAFSLFVPCIHQTKKFIAASPRTIQRYHFYAGEQTIDEITAIKYPAPYSYTGEEMLEIICHGGTVVSKSVLETLIKGGMRYAMPGEFTRRAFLNGKQDLSRAEAIHQIITSRTRKHHADAIQSYMGGHRTKLDFWKTELEKIVVELESYIEFGEEEDIRGNYSISHVKDTVKSIADQVNFEVEKYNRIQNYDQGLEIAIVGPPNAGKSSLLNFILGYNRAIVHPTRGTTRDFIKEKIVLDGTDLFIIDTAGLCAGESQVENIGIQRAWGYIEKSDIVLWVTAADEEFYPEELTIVEKRSAQTGLVAVINKIDVANGEGKIKQMVERGIPWIAISVQEERFHPDLINWIGSKVSEFASSHDEQSILLTARQEACIRKMGVSLRQINALESGQEEIITLYCHEALEMIDEFVGKKTTNEILDQIFNEFCIGK
jgi:tRNA modification GTPase